jgi:hypothetical protein
MLEWHRLVELVSQVSFEEWGDEMRWVLEKKDK